MKILYYDCFAGISGDMNLGAMVDLGVPLECLRAKLGRLTLHGYHLAARQEKRCGLRGTKLDVVQEHPAQAQPHRRLADIESIIGSSSLSDQVKDRSLRIFRALATAEAQVHGSDVQDVHFHEVGGLDTIVDIVGAAICREFLDVERVYCSPVELGGGIVRSAHGPLPVPAPATLELLRCTPVRYGLVACEMTTPTGAAILAGTVDEFTERMVCRPLKIGCGLGSRELEIPNMLRVVLGEKPAAAQERGWETEEAVLLACNIDDMNPELYDFVMELLFAAGAQDVFLTPVIMKKSRPAVVLNVLCHPSDQEGIAEIIFRQTSTIGVRIQPLTKAVLRRDTVTVATTFGEVAIKRVYLGERLLRSKPEYEDCKRLAKAHGVPIVEIYREAKAAGAGQGWAE